MAPTARAVINSWLRAYEVVEARVERMLERDVAARTADDSTVDPMGFVERTTNGIRLVPDQRIRRIVLAPSYFGRPYNSSPRSARFNSSATRSRTRPRRRRPCDSPCVDGPPVSRPRRRQPAADPAAPGQRDRYLTEIANELDLSKPTIKHHLAQLRSAGLITVTEQGNFTYYALRHDRAEEAGVDCAPT